MTRALDEALDRLLAAWEAPDLPDGFAERVTAEAARSDRPRTSSPSVRSRVRKRPWTRRGVFAGVLAINLILASAVAAAIGSGVLDFARVRQVAVRVIAHIVPHHAGPHLAPHHLLTHAAPAMRQSVKTQISRPVPRVRGPVALPARLEAAPRRAPHLLGSAPRLEHRLLHRPGMRHAEQLHPWPHHAFERPARHAAYNLGERPGRGFGDRARYPQMVEGDRLSRRDAVSRLPDRRPEPEAGHRGGEWRGGGYGGRFDRPNWQPRASTGNTWRPRGGRWRARRRF